MSLLYYSFRFNTTIKHFLLSKNKLKRFSSNCWKCNQKLSEYSLFCENSECKVVQKIEPNDINYFSLFGVSMNKLNMDTKDIELTFKNLQKQLHPDKFCLASSLEQEASAVTSSTINQVMMIYMGLFTHFMFVLNEILLFLQAYQTLKNPQLRLAYILSTVGINIGEKSASITDNKLLVKTLYS